MGETSFKFEVPPRLAVVVRDNLRTMDDQSVLVQLVGQTCEIMCARGDCLDVEVALACDQFVDVNNAADIEYVVCNFIADVGFCRTDNQDFERKSRLFVVDLWRVTFDDPRFLKSGDTVTDRTGGNINFICDFLDRDIACITLKSKQDSAVNFIDGNLRVGFRHVVGLIARSDLVVHTVISGATSKKICTDSHGGT